MLELKWYEGLDVASGKKNWYVRSMRAKLGRDAKLDWSTEAKAMMEAQGGDGRGDGNGQMIR